MKTRGRWSLGRSILAVWVQLRMALETLAVQAFSCRSPRLLRSSQRVEAGSLDFEEQNWYCKAKHKLAGSRLAGRDGTELWFRRGDLPCGQLTQKPCCLRNSIFLSFDTIIPASSVAISEYDSSLAMPCLERDGKLLWPEPEPERFILE